MAYLLANASRLRANKEHAEHRGITFEQYLAKRKQWSEGQRDEYSFYERSDRLDAFRSRYYPDDCEECKRKADIKKMQDEYEREQEEKARVRKQEAEVRQKEKDREANERRMMAAEDKPRTPPVVRRKKITDEEEERLRQLKIQEETALLQLKEVRLQMKNLNIDERVVENTLTYCSLCDKMFPSKTHRDRHMNTTKHKIRAGQMTKEVYPRHCDTCDYTAKLKHHWEQHCEGKKHKAKTEVQTVVIPTVEEPVKMCSEGEGHSASSMEDIVESS